MPQREDRAKTGAGKQGCGKVLDLAHDHQKEEQEKSAEEAGEDAEEAGEGKE